MLIQDRSLELDVDVDKAIARDSPSRVVHVRRYSVHPNSLEILPTTLCARLGKGELGKEKLGENTSHEVLHSLA